MDRPALQRLLADIEAGKIDVVVVYKVDRLTRSLADFAKMVELFDAHGVSFVSVTQQFNTTTSMGRLTLNVLLSFAQFEREVTAERIRDKIAASKRKGMWIGGMVPLGYDTQGPARSPSMTKEAEAVRTIFRRYLELGSLNLLDGVTWRKGIVTKRRTLRRPARPSAAYRSPAVPSPICCATGFTSARSHSRDKSCPGEQPAILDKTLFEAVQAKLSQTSLPSRRSANAVGALLMGRLFDDRGNRMRPTHARKNGIKYRYYLSRGADRRSARTGGFSPARARCRSRSPRRHSVTRKVPR